MRFHRIRLEGVGPLPPIDEQFPFPGLVVVLGPNESGKSTLCSSILAILHGFADKSEGLELKSWNKHKRFYGELEFSIGKRRFELARDFETDQVVLRQLDNDSSTVMFEGDANPRGRKGEALKFQRLLSEELGIPPRSIFDNTAHVPQLSIEIDLNEELRSQISGAGQGDYIEALDLLRNQYYELTREALPDERGGRNDRQLEKLQQEIDELVEGRRAASELSTQLRELHQKRDEAVQQRLELEDEHSQIEARATALETYLEALEKSEGLGQTMGLITKAEDRIRKLEVEVSMLQRQLDGEEMAAFRGLRPEDLEILEAFLDADGPATISEIDELSGRIIDLGAQLASEKFGGFDQSPANTSELLSELSTLDARIDKLEAEIEAQTPAREQERVGMRWGLVTGITALLAIVGAGIAAGLALVLDFASVVLAAVAGAALLGGFGFLTGITMSLILRLSRDKMSTDLARQSGRIEQMRQERTEIHDQLDHLLTHQTDVNYEVLRERRDEYSTLVEQRERLEVRKSTLADKEILQAAQVEAISEVLREAAPVILQERLKRYRKLSSDLSEGQQRLVEEQEERNELQTRIDKTSKATGEVQATLSKIEEAYPTFQSYRSNPEKGREELEGLSSQSARLKRRANEQAAEASDLELQVARETSSDLMDPTAIDELLGEKGEHYRRLVLRRDALATAHQLLSETIAEYQGDHLERLESLSTEYFREFTQGRYEIVRIGKGEEIIVQDREGHELPEHRLSTGARDQLFLAIRLAILDILSGDMCLPIMLDDSFVNFDSERLQSAKKTLAQIQEDRQVILVSHDDEFKNWSSHVIEL